MYIGMVCKTTLLACAIFREISDVDLEKSCAISRATFRIISQYISEKYHENSCKISRNLVSFNS